MFSKLKRLLADKEVLENIILKNVKKRKKSIKMQCKGV